VTRGINADGSYLYGVKRAEFPDTIIRPDIPSIATVLDTIKAKPDGGRLNAASLDSACARWRSRFCGRGGRKPAARSNKRKHADQGKIALAFWAAIREPAAFRK
jgi:hypothetical protein